MAEDRTAVLEMLRKASVDGDVDPPARGVRVLAPGRARTRATTDQPQRLSGPALGHPRCYATSWDLTWTLTSDGSAATSGHDSYRRRRKRTLRTAKYQCKRAATTLSQSPEARRQCPGGGHA